MNACSEPQACLPEEAEATRALTAHRTALMDADTAQIACAAAIRTCRVECALVPISGRAKASLNVLTIRRDWSLVACGQGSR